MPSPYLWFAAERLSPAELSAACLDGHLVELGEGYIPADAVETTWLRAGSLRGILGDALAATHLTAAWVHGALAEPPARHTVQRAVQRRLHHVMGSRIVYRDPAVHHDDLESIAGCLVTTPERTLADLARVVDEPHTRAARLLAAELPGVCAAAIAWLEGHGPLPHKRTGLAFLRGLAAAEALRTT